VARAYVQSSFNNTIVSITDEQGQVIVWSTAGACGFKGTKKGTPFAAQITADTAAKRRWKWASGKSMYWSKVPGPAAKRRSAIARSGVVDFVHSGRHAHPARRVPPAQTEESLSMSRYIGAVCRLCRREGTKLFLKGEKCFNACVLEKGARKFPPACTSSSGPRNRLNTAAVCVKKQKTKRIAGLTEEQFHRYFRDAERAPGLTGENLLRMLETRLDNVVKRLGFALSTPHARQLVLHGHVQVNDKRVDIPSYAVQRATR